MINRRTILLGLVGIGGVMLLADRTFVSSAGAGIEQFNELVAEARSASEIAQSLNSGDPVRIQDLLDRLVEEEGAEPDDTRADLFGVLRAVEPEPASGGVAGASENRVNPTSESRVSSIVKSASGGLAVIDGTPMRVGESRDGRTLLAVHPDRVVIEDTDGRYVLRLPVPGSPG